MLEFLLDPLGALVITFFTLSIISIAGIVLMFLVKNETFKKVFLFIFAAWSQVIMYCGILVSDGFWFINGVIALHLGALGIAAVIIQIFAKNKNKFRLARIMATVSVVAGIVNCFFI